MCIEGRRSREGDGGELIQLKKAILIEQPFLYKKFLLEFLFADTCFLTCQITEVEYSCPAYFTVFIDFNFINKRGSNRKYPFNTYIPRHLSYGKSFSMFFTASLYNNPTVLLDSLLVTFFNFIMYGNGISCYEFRKFIFYRKFFLNNIH